jgi:hypothetical protein
MIERYYCIDDRLYGPRRKLSFAWKKGSTFTRASRPHCQQTCRSKVHPRNYRWTLNSQMASEFPAIESQGD